jgi:hypothetical protein
MRQMHPLFETLGLSYDKPNRKRVDSAIRTIVDAPADAHCPEVWASIKAMTDGERDELPARVAEVLGL